MVEQMCLEKVTASLNRTAMSHGVLMLLLNQNINLFVV